MLEETFRPGETRAIRHAATRARILEAAWRLARNDGLAAVSLRDLAREVGMRAPSLYTYFPSKNLLYDAMYAQGLEQIADALERVPRGEDPQENIRARTRMFVRMCCEDPYRYELIFQRPIPGFEPTPESFAIGARAFAVQRRTLEEAGVTGERAIDMWRALITGLVGQQIANEPGGRRWVRLLDDSVDMFLAHHARPGRGKKR